MPSRNAKARYRLLESYVDAVLLRLEAGFVGRDEAHDELMAALVHIQTGRDEAATELMEGALRLWARKASSRFDGRPRSDADGPAARQ